MSRLLLPIAMLVAAGAILLTLTKPLLSEVTTLRAEKARLEAGLANATQLKEVRDGLLQKAHDFPKEDLDRLVKMLPDNVDNVKLIIDMNNLARGSGMNIRSVKIKTDDGTSGKDVIAESGQKKGAVTLSFGVSGPYNNFQDFLGRLAKSLRLVDVTAISFGSNEKNFYDYGVDIQTYWLK